jgi:tetratricopeptide (TPR) repeat protein
VLYGQYKDGLKVLVTGDYESAERIFKAILDHSYLQLVGDKDGENEDRSLINLKYIIYKNLASINSNNKGLEHLSTALDYLICAAKLDATDLCLWFDIGSVSLRLERFWIAKLAFEQSLLIDPGYWPSLDSFIVLVYALGDYSLCLRYVFTSLKLDKFYVNGVVLMKKIQMFEEAFYSQQIEVFVDVNYVSCGLVSSKTGCILF